MKQLTGISLVLCLFISFMGCSDQVSDPVSFSQDQQVGIDECTVMFHFGAELSLAKMDVAFSAIMIVNASLSPAKGTKPLVGLLAQQGPQLIGTPLAMKSCSAQKGDVFFPYPGF